MCIRDSGNDADLQGVELIYQKFKNKLAEKGLKAMEVKPGDDFNVDLHEAITPVSYTHLDVYKRQFNNRSRQICRDFFC